MYLIFVCQVTMHSERHAGGVFEIKEGKTMEITQDRCHKDIDYDDKSKDTNSPPSGKAPAPDRFT